MIFILIAFLWQAFAHYIDWRRFVRGSIPQPIMLIVNYIIGTLGMLISYELWVSLTVAPASAAWILALDTDPRWKFPFVLLGSGLSVGLWYTLDLLRDRGNSSATNDELIRIKDQRILELEQELDAKNKGS